MRLSILIPAYNEEKTILHLLEGIRLSKVKFEFEVIVLPNGCTDSTAKVAKHFKQEHADFPLEVVELKTGGKTRALNQGINLAKGELIAQLDADCRLEPTTLSKIVNTFGQAINLKLLGGLDKPIYDEFDKDTLLYKTLRSRQIYRELRGRVIPVGRCMAYRKDLQIHFPENIHSEDNWLAFWIADKFGWPSIKVLTDALVYYYPPRTWDEFLSQETRFDQGHIQILKDFPELKAAFKRRREGWPELDMHVLTTKLKEEGLDINLLNWINEYWETVVQENSDSTEALFNGSSWEPAHSTKR